MCLQVVVARPTGTRLQQSLLAHRALAGRIACFTMAKLIDGRAIAARVYLDLRREIAELKAKGVTPGLAVILVGDNPASRAYVRSKDKMCRELGLHSVKSGTAGFDHASGAAHAR